MARRVISWLIVALIVLFGIFAWKERQQVIDTVRVAQYQPSNDIASISNRVSLSDRGEFLFYASTPKLAARDDFNTNCQRREADSPILGCYTGQKIYLFDVTDRRLDGIEEVTAAHEMLHAAYERMSEREKAELHPLLQSAYAKVQTDELATRMDYYNRTEPGEADNELHSILGTEFSKLGNKLEKHYKTYFKNRTKIIALHRQAQATFQTLSKQADKLVAQAEQLVSNINRDTQQYNKQTNVLEADIRSFNNRASQPNGFSSEAEFQAARNDLIVRQSALQADREAIASKIARYNDIVKQLEAINTETKSLNQSLDSTLDPAPTL